MKYRISDLHVMATPKADKMFELPGLPQVEFNFPGDIKTVLFIHYGLVRASLRGGEDHLEIVGRLYKSDNPKETGEDHIGKLYIHAYNYPHNTRFKTSIEQLEWHSDRSFDVISESGEIERIRKLSYE